MLHRVVMRLTTFLAVPLLLMGQLLLILTILLVGTGSMLETVLER